MRNEHGSNLLACTTSSRVMTIHRREIARATTDNRTVAIEAELMLPAQPVI